MTLASREYRRLRRVYRAMQHFGGQFHLVILGIYYVRGQTGNPRRWQKGRSVSSDNHALRVVQHDQDREYKNWISGDYSAGRGGVVDGFEPPLAS